MLVKQTCYIQTKCIDYIEKWPFMVIFQYNLYIFGIHLWTVLYPKPCYNEQCYKEVGVYMQYDKGITPIYSNIVYNMFCRWKSKDLLSYTGWSESQLYVYPLIHLCKMDSSTSTLWTGPFLLEGMSGLFLFLPCFNENSVSNANSADPDQSLIWVYTICKCPFYGTLSINGLSSLFAWHLPPRKEKW